MRIVAGRWGGRRIGAPPGRATRPTTDRVREAWMSAVAGDLPGARVADLFAGSGALGLEALSRGAAHAVFVERAAPALRTLHANVATLEAGDRATVVRGDVLRFLDDVDPEWDLAFADPPYGQGLGAALIERFADRP
ncbi:MAG: 16S rRNA (guanine(966)-N(2))-methyltransferase RsmD, partial [Gemmatimonadota bacterium]|nr:16S rRNA (guanine(966)-N(2))-methyltransferase RsmD [Gemmatimonadota bacterium]